ncbi:alpha-1A adrenergic receptor-like [Montipora foliosa]|uniref:alpha-1A adrenergic receptor-like n=1 Tax=Montipora foliosa TaxID=591990 RepID=UPI0035F1C487
MIQSELKDVCTKLTFCKAIAFFSFFLISVIIFHLVLISVDRFVAIKFSLRYHSILTHRRTLIASIAMWLWAALITLVLPQILKAIPNENAADLDFLISASHPCLEAMTGQTSNSSIEPYYKFFMKTTQLGIPLVIILCTYSYVYIVSHKHRSHIAAQKDAQRNLTLKQEMKGARILAITVALCLLSLLPISLMCLLADGKLSPQYRSTPKRIAYTLAMGMNAICNPLVYGLGNQQVRKALRRMFKGA